MKWWILFLDANDGKYLAVADEDGYIGIIDTKFKNTDETGSCMF
jgi:hypothetical protein